MKPKIKVIYYVHGTLSDRNVVLSSWALGHTLKHSLMRFGPHHIKPEIVIVNSGFDGEMSAREIRREVFGAVSMVAKDPIHEATPPKTKSVAQDIQWQIDNIRGADWYLCAKADFVLHSKFWSYLSDFVTEKHDKPVFVNCAKFDLREHVSNDMIVGLTSINRWDLVANLNDGCPHYNVPYWGDHINYVGYDGIDGCFHFYSEEARKRLKIPHFMNQETWNMNEKNGIEMRHGDWRFFGYHVWHDIPRPDPKKGKPGHRF